jgi:hypothetical protein
MVYVELESKQYMLMVSTRLQQIKESALGWYGIGDYVQLCGYNGTLNLS